MRSDCQGSQIRHQTRIASASAWLWNARLSACADVGYKKKSEKNGPLLSARGIRRIRRGSAQCNACKDGSAQPVVVSECGKATHAVASAYQGPVIDGDAGRDKHTNQKART